jgi:hypothetical protein
MPPVSRNRTPPLFEVLPDGIFAALAAPNRHLHWRVLHGIYRARFGPDAPAPPIDGYPKSEIVHDMANLLQDTEWEGATEAREGAGTIEQMAHNFMNQFERWGWFVVERIGVRERVNMRPLVVELVTFLGDFVERGPVFLSAEVRSIALQLADVLENEGPAASFQKAAADSRAILNHLAATRIMVRDVMSEINHSKTTAEFAKTFFSSVSKTFIADYSELKLRNHPLARRGEILELARRIGETTSVRERLIAWYTRDLTGGDSLAGEERFERDMRRILDLDRIEEHLERLDYEFHSANKRAVAFMNYRMQAPRDFDRLAMRAVEAVISNPQALHDAPAPAGDLISEFALRERRGEAAEFVREPVTRRTPTVEQLAAAKLEREAMIRRQVDARKIARYLASALGDGMTIASQDLPITSIEDLRAYQTLIAAGMESNGAHATVSPAKALLSGALVKIDHDTFINNGYLKAPRFVVTLPSKKEIAP